MRYGGFKMKNLFSSLYFRLLLIVLFSLVPSFGLILYSTIELRVQAEREIQEDVIQLGHSIALEEDELIGGARQLLVSLGENQRLLTFDKNYSDSLLKNLMNYIPRYANIGVIKPNGNLVASGVLYADTIDLSDRKFFRQALQTKQFSVGSFEIGRVTHQPSINFGYPILTERGEVKAVIFAALDLSWLAVHEQASMSHLQLGSIFAKMDSNGIVVAYQPGSSERLGKPLPWTFLEAIKRNGHGIAEDSSPDGIFRIFAFDAVSGSKLFGGDLYVVIGLPKDSLLAVFKRFLVQNTSAIGVVALLVLAFAWISSEFLILRPARAILHTTEELRGGNLNARTGLLRKEGDIGRLAFSVDQMAGTLQNLEGKLRDSQSRLRNLATHLLSAREEERKRVAREVHDELGQVLTAMKMDLRWVEKRLEPTQSGVRDKIREVVGLTDQTIRTVQRISSELRPGVLDDLGLVAGIEWLGEDFSRRSGIPCTVQVEVSESYIGSNSATALFRVIQEALTNIARHARASRASVEFTKSDGNLQISVRDDGVGITKKQIEAQSSLGLIGIRERVEGLGGMMSISGEAGAGTTIVITIPLQSKALS